MKRLLFAFLLLTSGFSLLATAQSRTNRLYRPCPGSTTPATVSISVSGNITATPCSGGTVVIGGVKVYRAILTQAGTAAPTATVLENSLGGTVVWTRLGVGSYQGALTGAFTANKTFINQIVMSDNLNGWLAELFLSSTSAVTLTTLDAGTPADATITPTNPAFVEILVYP